jgi:hypothetical protein
LKCTAYSEAEPTFVAVHVAPPSSLRTVLPAAPTAHTRCSSHACAHRSLPAQPSARTRGMQWRGKEPGRSRGRSRGETRTWTQNSAEGGAGVCSVQLAPPSRVRAVAPPLPAKNPNAAPLAVMPKLRDPPPPAERCQAKGVHIHCSPSSSALCRLSSQRIGHVEAHGQRMGRWVGAVS